MNKINKFGHFIKKALWGQPPFAYFSVTLVILLTIFSLLYFKDRTNRGYLTLSDDLAVASSGEIQPTSCDSKVSGPEKIQCWDDLTASTLKKEGIESAFRLLAKLYKSDPSFAENCHAMAHRIGNAAYKLFSKDGKVQLSDETTWCGYGFYHSFIEDMLAAGEPLGKVREICNSLNRQMVKKDPNSTERCYHGIGHGAATLHGKTLTGNEKPFVAQAIKICKAAVTNENQLGSCASGVFNAIEIDYNNGSIKLNRENPFWICGEQEGVFKTVCYGYLSSVVLRSNNNDFAKAVKFIENIKEDSLAFYAIKIVATTLSYPNIRKVDHSEFIKKCYSIQKRLIPGCIEGYASGLMTVGEPGKEYIHALNFCNSNGLGEEERRYCFKIVLEESSHLYPTPKYNSICQEFEKRYSGLCKS